MRLLLDTHSLLWFVAGETRLSQMARALIEDSANEKLVSAASLWEIAIKVSIGKLTLALPFGRFVSLQIEANGFVSLGIEAKHLAQVATLPFHHRDPFDRLLIAQGITEGVSIVSADAAFDAYGVARLW